MAKPGIDAADVPAELFVEQRLGPMVKALQQLLDKGIPADAPFIISMVFPGLHGRQLAINRMAVALGGDARAGLRFIVELLIPPPPGAYAPGVPGPLDGMRPGGEG